MTDAVCSAARGWLGTPYMHQASLRGVGCDCLGLARGLWRELIGPEHLPVPPYTPDWGEVSGQEVLIEAFTRALVRVSPEGAVPGTLLVFRMHRRAIAKHCGVLVTPDSFIHARERLGVIEEPLTPAWRRRVVAAFVFPERG